MRDFGNLTVKTIAYLHEMVVHHIVAVILDDAAGHQDLKAPVVVSYTENRLVRMGDKDMVN